MESKSPFQDAIDNTLQFGQAWMDSFGQSTQSCIVETQAQDWAQWMRSSVEHPANSIEQQMNLWGQQVNLFNDCIMSSLPTEKEKDRFFFLFLCET